MLAGPLETNLKSTIDKVIDSQDSLDNIILSCKEIQKIFFL